MAGGNGKPERGDTESLAEVLASIRALVSAETAARVGGDENGADVLMLTPERRVVTRTVRSGEILAEGLDRARPRVHGAPILDEEALRGVINAIVRDELQGELGERISRNLRKLIRRELAEMLAEREKEREKE
jgi:hypothetical protein